MSLTLGCYLFSVILFEKLWSTYSIIFNVFGIFKIKMLLFSFTNDVKNLWSRMDLKKKNPWKKYSKMLISLWVIPLWVILIFFSILSKYVLLL